MHAVANENRRKPMSCARLEFLLCLLAVLGFAVAAQAQTGRWQSSRGADGAATVSLRSTNTLSTGNQSIEYHPVLAIACKSGQPSSWTQSVRIREATSGSGTVRVSVQVDGSSRSEEWRLGSRNNSLSLDGREGISRLLGARRLHLEWRMGYFSGRGEAVFSLAGIKEAVGKVAAACGIDPP
jgi:hypothetical protein